MEYKRIVAVTGLPGLFEVVSSRNDGALVRNLEDGVTKFIASRVHNLSQLESIEIYTEEDNVNLVEIFAAMQASATPRPDGKEGAALRSYFEEVYPQMDFERVYTSDMKKMVKWFEILSAKGVEMKVSEEAGEEGEEREEGEVDGVDKGDKGDIGDGVDSSASVETAAQEAAPAKKAAKQSAPAASAEGEDTAPATLEVSGLDTGETAPVKKTRKKKED